MRFLNQEKVLIILLHYLQINFFKISKIVNALRSNKDRDEVIITLKLTDRKVIDAIKGYQYEYDLSRDKPCYRTGIKKVVDKWLKEGSIDNNQRSNYSTKLSSERIEYLCNYVKSSPQNRKLSLRDLKSELHLITVTRQTIGNYLNKKKLVSRVAKSASLLNQFHIEARLAFVREYIDKPIEFWLDVVFVDEKTFQNYKNGRTLIRISEDEDINDPMFRSIKDKSGAFSVNLFGYLSSKGCGIFQVDDINRFQYLLVLKESFSVINQLHNGNFFWLQDNCKVHNSDMVTSYLDTKKIKRINFPAKSFDLNVIEHFWALLQKNVDRLISMNRQPASKNELFEICVEATKMIQADTCLNLVKSVKARLEKVQEYNGLHCK